MKEVLAIVRREQEGNKPCPNNYGRGMVTGGSKEYTSG